VTYRYANIAIIEVKLETLWSCWFLCLK